MFVCRKGAYMRKLMLLLIAFIAVVTFIRAFERSGTETIPMHGSALQNVESGAGK